MLLRSLNILQKSTNFFAGWRDWKDAPELPDSDRAILHLGLWVQWGDGYQLG